MTRHTSAGVLSSVGASVLFGVVSLMAGRIHVLDAQQVTAWRVVCLVGLFSLFLTLSHGWSAVRGVLDRLRRGPALIPVVLFCAAMQGAQLWVYIWGPMNGQELGVSFGYFLMPLVVTLIGAVVFKDEFGPWNVVATALAGLAVLFQLFASSSFSWTSALIGLGYPVYFGLRRWFGLDHTSVFWLETALLVVPSVWLLTGCTFDAVRTAGSPGQSWALIGLGGLGGVALIAYIFASGSLSLVLFGLLCYLEPVMLFLVALVLGERLSPVDHLVYGLLVVALACLGVPALHLERLGDLVRGGRTTASAAETVKGHQTTGS